MKYLCLICAEVLMEQMPDAEAEMHLQDYADFTEAIRKSGHFIGCNRLLPPQAATTVRVRRGRVSTTDGPYAETKEQLGGYYLIDVPDLDAALSWLHGVPRSITASSKCVPSGTCGTGDP